MLGGCMIGPGQPDCGCLDCDYRWSLETLPVTAITKVRFKIWERFYNEKQKSGFP